MPGTNAGTGQPISFMCAKARRLKDWRTGYVPKGHQVYRTGREKPAPQGAGVRMDPVSREYQCSCGHVGWSKHKELGRYPLAPEPDEINTEAVNDG